MHVSLACLLSLISEKILGGIIVESFLLIKYCEEEFSMKCYTDNTIQKERLGISCIGNLGQDWVENVIYQPLGSFKY